MGRALLQPTLAVGHCARERSLDVPEQCRHRRVAPEGRTVHLDEGVGGQQFFGFYAVFIGMCLLLCSLLMGFTGYSLVFEQLSYWGATVGANLCDVVPVVGPIAKAQLAPYLSYEMAGMAVMAISLGPFI